MNDVELQNGEYPTHCAKRLPLRQSWRPWAGSPARLQSVLEGVTLNAHQRSKLIQPLDIRGVSTDLSGKLLDSESER